jgi:FlaA1/EpsC-like NDP-sugar epimerase
MEKVVITGGTGCLGRALIDRLHTTTLLTVFSRSEKAQLDLRVQYPGVRVLVGDILDRAFLVRTFQGATLVIHAAALKHVDLSEAEPAAYIRINVQGSLNVLDALGPDTRAVGISTDKACVPQNVYGMTKHLMERMFVERGRTAVRYGNVFGSDGSVLYRWREQLQRTGTIRITDPEMTRFFFPIAAAVDEVLWAANWPEAVVVPRLRATTLLELAQAFVHVHGGAIHVVGPRPGEKQHEMLLSPEEARRSTLEEGRALLRPSAFPASAVAPLRSAEAERIPFEELVAWIG